MGTDTLTNFTRDEVQQIGALAYFDGRKLSDNPYKVSDYDIPAGDPRGMKKAIREVAAAWKCGYVVARAEAVQQRKHDVYGRPIVNGFVNTDMSGNKATA